MNTLRILLLLSLLSGCAVEVVQQDPWRQRIARCGSAIVRCDGGSW